MQRTREGSLVWTWFVLLALGGGIVLAVTGCATQASTQSGFLRDYTSLRPTSAGSDPLASRISVQPPLPAQLASYQAVYLEPVTITADGLDPEQTASVAEVTNTALREEFAKTWPLADRPGPRVLRVRSAVTGVTKANVPLNVAMTLVATAVSNGGAAGEAELVDSATGRRVGALTWADEKRFSSPLGFYAETAHARALLPEFAAEVAKLAAR